MSVEAPLEDWRGQVPVIGHANQCFIDGRYVDAADGRTFDCVSPIDGRHLTAVARGGVEDIDRAVRAARRAFESGAWSRAAPRLRKRVLRRWAQLIRERTSELALIETLDMGKPIGDSSAIDVPATANCIEFYGEAVDKIYDEVAPTAGHVMAMMLREPLGVVGAVVPWNFPMLMAAWKLGPALATGNSVVLKPAEQSPLSALVLAELAAEAGLPDGVLNVVPGYGEEAGRALGLHPDVDVIAFTGSTEVGKLFLKYAGDSNMKRVWLECGGKTPHIVLPDCPDLDLAAENAAFGIFFNQGQVCNAGSRLLVHESIKDDFLAKVLDHARALQPGDPLDPATKLGAMVDRMQMERVLAYVAAGHESGADLVLGGQRVRTETGGFYIEPTVFDGVTNDMTIAREEIFGPVLSTLTFHDTDDALRIANDTIYGLAAAIWTSDINIAMKAARALRAGSVWVNCFDGGDITTPFGGFKQSGFGRDKSLHAMDKFTDWKTVWIEVR